MKREFVAVNTIITRIVITCRLSSIMVSPPGGVGIFGTSCHKNPFRIHKPGVYFERKSKPYTQTILHAWGAYSRPPMPIYAVVIAQMASIDPYQFAYRNNKSTEDATLL